MVFISILLGRIKNLISCSCLHCELTYQYYLFLKLLGNDEVESAREIFQRLDINNDGKLSREELIEGYKGAFGEFAEEEVDRIMNNADIDKNGEINYSEWVMASSNLKKLVTEEKLETAFQFFDKDKNGQISI